MNGYGGSHVASAQRPNPPPAVLPKPNAPPQPLSPPAQYPYHQPVVGYHSPPGYGTPYNGASPSSQQQQQDSVVVISSQQAPVAVHRAQSFVRHIIFSCVVFWLCNPLFGLIAFILAVMASNNAVSNPQKAMILGRVSCGLSNAGLIISAVIITIVGAMFEASASTKYSTR